MTMVETITQDQVTGGPGIAVEWTAPAIAGEGQAEHDLALWACIARQAEMLHARWDEDSAELDTLLAAAGCETWDWHAVRTRDGQLYVVTRMGEGLACARRVQQLIDLSATQAWAS